MTWGAIGGAAIGMVSSSMSDSGGSGGGQSQTISKDPWSSAAPWLQENIKSGQALQNRYAANPFSAQQTQGYNNQYGNADYMRSLTGSVLGQLNGFQPFDRGNQDARPQAFQFPSMQGPQGGQSSYLQAPMPAPVMQQAAAPAPAPAGADADALQKLRQELYSSRALADPSLDHPGWGGNWGY